jgi:hypothetical protein
MDILKRGLTLSMELQRAVVRQATAIIEKMMVKTLRKFRLVILKDGPDLPLFTHPLSLSKLALFLVDALRVVFLATKCDTACCLPVTLGISKVTSSLCHSCPERTRGHIHSRRRE